MVPILAFEILVDILELLMIRGRVRVTIGLVLVDHLELLSVGGPLVPRLGSE